MEQLPFSDDDLTTDDAHLTIEIGDMPVLELLQDIVHVMGESHKELVMVVGKEFLERIIEELTVGSPAE